MNRRGQYTFNAAVFDSRMRGGVNRRDLDGECFISEGQYIDPARVEVKPTMLLIEPEYVDVARKILAEYYEGEQT